MKLLLIRHAPAGLRETFAETGRDDGERPLTGPGRRRMRRTAKALPLVVPAIDVLATSPLTRATQTAAIVSRAYGDLKPIETGALEPERRPWELAEWLATIDPVHTVAAVGHEPTLSQAVAWFLSGLTQSFLELKKGGVCLLDFPREVKGGGGTLLFALRPGQLRRMR